MKQHSCPSQIGGHVDSPTISLGFMGRFPGAHALVNLLYMVADGPIQTKVTAKCAGAEMRSQSSPRLFFAGHIADGKGLTASGAGSVAMSMFFPDCKNFLIFFGGRGPGTELSGIRVQNPRVKFRALKGAFLQRFNIACLFALSRPFVPMGVFDLSAAKVRGGRFIGMFVASL